MFLVPSPSPALIITVLKLHTPSMSLLCDTVWSLIRNPSSCGGWCGKGVVRI